MTIEVKVPILPESVSDALLLDWIKQPGDRVERDEILVEIETDKVVLEIPAPVGGTLTKIIEASGSTVVAEQVLAIIEKTAVQSDNTTRSQPADAPTEINNTPPQAETTQQQEPQQQESEPSHNKAALTSPAVRRLAAETGINLRNVKGSGRDGRITKEDVLFNISNTVDPEDIAQPTTTQNTVAPASVTPATKSVTAPVADKHAMQETTRPSDDDNNHRVEKRIPMSRLRQTIARRLVESQQSTVTLTTFNEVNMQAVIDLRARHKDSFEKRHGVRLGFMSFFCKASAVALERFPLVNARIDGDQIVQHEYVDMGIAVSSSRGLVVPIIRDCQSLNYAQIETQIRDFGDRAQQGKITIDELAGGTFTVTNGGVFGSLVSTPIVNPPQSAILGMHKIEKRPIVENDEIVIRPIMQLALSYDHRIIDGKEAVQFLVDIKNSIEDPSRILLNC